MKNGGLKSLLTLMADYNLPYQYAMVLMTKLPIPSLYAIKFFSVFFDFVLAFYVFKVIHELTLDEERSFLGGIIALALPTVLMNSAGWGQSDAIYTTFLVAAVYYVLRQRPAMVMWMFTLSFGFKIQAIFIGPLMLVLLLKGFFKIKHLFIPALYYALVSLPIMLVGGTLTRILEIAALQINIRNGFSFYLPNLYYVFNFDQYLDYASVKNVFILGFLVMMAGLTYLCYRKLDIENQQQVVAWAALFALIVPFLLVRMHERYYFPAEYFWLILTLLNPRKYRLRFFIILLASVSAYITVSWWGVTETSYVVLPIMLTYVYPFLSLGVLYVVASALRDEAKEQSHAI